MKTLKERFEQYEDEFLKDDKDTPMPRDLQAMLLLHRISPSKRTIIVQSEHDEIFFSTDVNALQENASNEDIEQLVRLGVRYSEFDGGLSMLT